MTRRSAPRRLQGGRIAYAFCALAVVGLAAGCSDVKEGLEDADKALSGALNVEQEPEFQGLSGPPLAESLYESGLRLKGEGEDPEAFARFLAAAERGHGPGAYEVSEAYSAGRGVGQDATAAARWMNTAAERGDPRAQYALGAAYYKGTGVGQDYASAVVYLGQAAEQGHAEAQFLLAECYANGRGVTRNLPWAARWYGKAAEQGHAEGAFSYGVVHAAGLGMPVSLPLGYAWLDIASERGHTKAGEVRGAIANKMTPQQIAAGKQRADNFQPSSTNEFADRPTVMYVQQSLNQLGFNAGTVDGLMGPRTRSAIQAYLASLGENDAAGVTPSLVQRLFEGQQGAA